MNTTLLRSIFVALAVSVALPACRSKSEEKSAPEITAESMPEQGVITEQHDSASVTWSVARDGQVKALVKTPDGKPIQTGVTGTIIVKGEGPEATPVELPLVPDPKTGMLIGLLPKQLDADVTEMDYELKINGKPVQGTLHIPPGGTAELEANAKVAAKVTLPEGKGPNGGVVQVVGEDVVEIVADKSSGNVRLYVLDDGLKPVKIEDRKVKVAFVSPEGPDTIVLAPDPGGLYFTGKMRVIAPPRKITVALTYRGETDVVLCGYRPGAVVMVGAAAPSFGVLVDVSWGVAVAAPVIVVDGHHHWKGKGKGKGKGKWKGRRGGDVHIHVH
jgi:hypothetical protein